MSIESRLTKTFSEYNKAIEKTTDFLNSEDSVFVVPNNGNTWYLFTAPKGYKNYVTCYFFQNNTRCNNWCVEIEHDVLCKSECLFEGYIYNQTENISEKQHFLISDFLVLNGQVLYGYADRMSKVPFQIDTPETIVGIHPSIKCNLDCVEKYYYLFTKNPKFKFGSELTRYTVIPAQENGNVTLVKNSVIKRHTEKSKKGVVSKTEIPHVYAVGKELLYIKTRTDSLKLYDYFKKNTDLKTNLKFNTRFGKWEIQNYLELSE